VNCVAVIRVSMLVTAADREAPLPLVPLTRERKETDS
jgi:hypothetical protein